MERSSESQTISSNMVRSYTTPKQLLAISALWFGMNYFWSVLLPVWVPSRVGDFAPDQKGTYQLYITAFGALLSTLIQLVIGPISDQTTHRWGRRRPFILFGVLATIPPLFWFASAQTFVTLMIAFALIQVFLNIATGPYQAVMPDLVPEEKHGAASGYMGLALLLGQGFALPFAGIVLGMKDQPMRFYWLAISMSVVLLLTTLWTLTQTRETPLSRETRKPVNWKQMFDFNLKEHPDFKWLIISRFFINLGFYTATNYLLYYMQDSIGLGEKAELTTGLLLVLATFAGVIGNWPAAVYSDRISKKRVLYFTCGILAFSVLWFLVVKSVTWVYVVGIVFGIGWGAFSAVDWALAANLVPMKEAGRYMAIWHLAFTLPQVVAPIAGPIADRVNAVWGHGLGWRVALGFILVYLLIGAWAVRFINERKTPPIE